MSLKAFHIFFIVLSVTLAAGFGTWALRQNTPWSGSLGVVSLAVGAVLAVYLVWFIRKMKRTAL